MGIVRETFEPLAALDLKRCLTVGELVRAMGKCSFVARQIGEVAETLFRWCQESPKPYISWKWILQCKLVGPSDRNALFYPAYANSGRPNRVDVERRLVEIGRFSEGEEHQLFHRSPENTIFINREGLCIPGQVRDGYFPNVVFEDPRFVMPVISAALDEWLKIKVWTVTELFRTLPQYGGVAAEVVEGARVLKTMVDDSDCTVFMTASGAMTIAQLDYLFCDMIEDRMVQYLATTGALMAHGLVKSTGYQQFKHRPEHGDQLYAEEKINRVTDTLEPEENFDHIDEVMNAVLDSYPPSQADRVTSPSELHQIIGGYLSSHFPNERGILKSASKRKVPVCVPAFVDSELGNDVFCYNAANPHRQIIMNMERDTRLLAELALKSKRMGIFSLGGGVPRNNTQNVAPLIEIYKARLGLDDLPDRQFFYGCRICPDNTWHGHLSGCTYSENESWRKMVGVATSGNFAEVHADATVTWPFILKWVQENRAR